MNSRRQFSNHKSNSLIGTKGFLKGNWINRFDQISNSSSIKDANLEMLRGFYNATLTMRVSSAADI